MPASWRRGLAAAAAWLLITIAPAGAQVPQGALERVLGANKPDLLLQYLGNASGADGSPAARAVTMAMARKSLADAAGVGFGFLRIMAAGYGPSAPPPAGAPGQNDLALWQTDPALYWSRVDAMFDDLDAAGFRIVPSFLWNPLQFPALAHQTMADLITDPYSLSRALLQRYVRQFVSRYARRQTILFYELTNELNLEADLDIRGRCLKAASPGDCAAAGNFSSAQMTEFAGTMVRQIRRLDPTRKVGSGYALPRPNAMHLAAQPEFSGKGADWTPDTRAQFAAALEATGAPFELWSVHVYPGDVRWGNPPGSEALTLRQAALAARESGRRIYLGEFGDSSDSPYLRAMLRELAFGTPRAEYAAVWVWEWYQQATWLSADLTSAPPMSLEPGFTDPINRMLANAAGGPHPTLAAPVNVVLTTPLPCAALDGPIELYATASAAGAQPVDLVVFMVDERPVGVAFSAPFHVPYRPVGPGQHRITAIAAGGGGMAISETPVMVGGGEGCVVP
jgi:Bacterial Ig domain